VLVPELSYKTLGIQEGGSAQRFWMEAILDGKRENEKKRFLSDLFEYAKWTHWRWWRYIRNFG